MHEKPSNTIEPFIQWVGGKRKIADQLINFIPTGLNNYYEPFLGGGALFFKVIPMFKQCYLSDINLDLVTSYNAVKKNPEEVCTLLEEHKDNHSKEYYYHMRDTNNSSNPVNISARFLYLNKYAFRGIYRINNNDKLSLSFSTRTYANSNLNKIKTCSNFLQNVTISAGDFSFIEPKENDFVYFDPPYHKSGEKFYTRLPFDESEQIRLRDFAKELDNQGVKIMLSNSNTEFIRELYKDFNIRTIEIKYCIPEKRKISKEVLVTNF